MTNKYVGILTVILMVLSIDSATVFAGQSYSSLAPLCSKATSFQSWGTELLYQERIAPLPASKTLAQEDCPAIDTAVLTGDRLIDHIQKTSTECYEHFRSLYQEAYDLSTIFTDRNMQSAFKAIERLAPSYDGTNSTGMLQLWTFARDGYWYHEQNSTRLGSPFNEATHRAHIAASAAFAASDHFFSLNDSEAAETLAFYLQVADREGVRQHHLETIKLILLEIPSKGKGKADDTKRRFVISFLLLLLNRGLDLKDQGFIDALSRDPEIVDALLQATRYDFVYENPFTPAEVLGALGRLSQLPSLEEATIAALTSVVIERERFSSSFLLAAELLEDRIDCTSLNICSDTLKRELHTRLFPNTYSFDDGLLVFETPLNIEVVQSLYRATKEVEAQFYRLLETNEPIRDKKALRVKIYGSKLEYWQFHKYLSGFGITPAGLYSPQDITVYTYYATDGQNFEEVFRHEYGHYLADFFFPTGLGADCLLTWFHEGLAEFLVGSTQTKGISVLRYRIESIIRQEAGSTQRFDPARIFDFCYGSFGFKVHDYNYSSLFFHFLYQQRRTQLLELIGLVRSSDIKTYLHLIDTWAEDRQLAVDYSAFVDEQIANVEQLAYHPTYSIFLSDADLRSDPLRETAILPPAVLHSDSSTEIERALQQINGDLDLNCQALTTGINPRFECTGSLQAGAQFSVDRGASSLFQLFADRGAQFSVDRGGLNEHLNARLDSFIVAAVEDGKINNFEHMNCYFTKAVGNPPVANLYCEGPLRPMDLARARIDLKTALCCASDIGGNATDALVSRLRMCGIGSCDSELSVPGKPLYLWTTLGFSTESASNVTLTWSASLPVHLDVFVPKWLSNQCEIVKTTEQTGTLACGPVYDRRAKHALDFAPYSQRRGAASRLGIHLELALHVTPLQAGLLDFTIEFSSDEMEIEPADNVASLQVQIGLPNSSQLQQNAPNPFNSQTVLSYFLPAPGPVRLEVFALTGQRVALLQQGPQQAGYHRHRWDGRDNAGHRVASGMYLYRLTTDEAVLTRKLMLLR